MASRSSGQEKVSVKVTDKASGDVTYSNVETKEIPVDLKELQDINHAAKVRVAAGVTKDLTNYEFLRADVAIELPCVPTPDKLDSTYDYCLQWVGEKLDTLVAAAASV